MGGPFQSFKPKSSVPIIGQPFEIRNFFVTLQIVCTCAGREPVLLVGNGIGTCPACQRAFQLQGLKSDPAGNLQFAIGLVRQERSQEQPEIPEPAGAPS